MWNCPMTKQMYSFNLRNQLHLITHIISIEKNKREKHKIILKFAIHSVDRENIQIIIENGFG